MKKIICGALGILMLSATAFPSMAQTAQTSRGNSAKAAKQKKSNSPQKTTLAPLQIERFTLPNGLRVVLNPDNAVPVVAVAVYYDVGARNEQKGRTGFAHLFEHMMFQGSENIKKAEHFKYVSNVGGVMNGTTNSERTNYYEVVPANQLPLALWLESDRMRSLAVTKENLDNQRNAVQEEKRLSQDNQPYGQVFITGAEMIFKNFANSHSLIGSMEDLNAATVDEIKDFFRIYYAPNNAVLTISGSFDSKEAKTLIEKYFATIPRQPAPPSIDVSEPREIVRKYQKMEDKLAPLPAFIMGWKIPDRTTDDFKALSLACTILFEGESSRLYQKMVKGDESVVQIFGDLNERRGPSAIILGALPKDPSKVAEIRQAILNEVKNLATGGVTAKEMEKLHNNLINSEIRKRQSSLDRARAIAEFTLYDDNPAQINTSLDEMLKITPEQIKAAVAKYMDNDNFALLEVVPAGKGDGK